MLVNTYNEKQEQYIIDNLDSLTESALEQQYQELLNEPGLVDVGGLTFEPARVIEELDPTAYRCGLIEYIDSLKVMEVQGGYYEKSELDLYYDEIEELA